MPPSSPLPACFKALYFKKARIVFEAYLRVVAKRNVPLRSKVVLAFVFDNVPEHCRAEFRFRKRCHLVRLYIALGVSEAFTLANGRVLNGETVLLMFP